MMLDISEALRAPGAAVPFRHLEPLEPMDVLGQTVTYPEPAVVEGFFTLQDETLVITAQLRVTALANCARCLDSVAYSVDVPVHESFLREDPRDQAEEDPWEERLVFSGHRVDLSHLVLSLAVLDLPIRFLCEGACKGPALLIPQGPNDEETLDEHPFSALRQLFTKNQEE